MRNPYHPSDISSALRRAPTLGKRSVKTRPGYTLSSAQFELSSRHFHDSSGTTARSKTCGIVASVILCPCSRTVREGQACDDVAVRSLLYVCMTLYWHFLTTACIRGLDYTFRRLEIRRVRGLQRFLSCHKSGWASMSASIVCKRCVTAILLRRREMLVISSKFLSEHCTWQSTIATTSPTGLHRVSGFGP